MDPEGAMRNGPVPSPRAAGAMIAGLSSIPKRVTQHGVFLSGAEAPIASLKPGQQQLHRQGFYTTEVPALRETYLTEHGFKESVYKKEHSSARLPEDYQDPQKPILRPQEAITHKVSSHWVSEYDAMHSARSIEGASRRTRAPDPYSFSAAPVCLSRPSEESSYRAEYGALGHDPRNRLAPGQTTLPVKKDALTAGTTKGTNHIPGYQGFLPTNTNHPKVRRVEQGEKQRSVDKTCLVNTYHLNVPGYAGHLPTEVINDKGPRQVSTMTVSGQTLGAAVGLA